MILLNGSHPNAFIETRRIGETFGIHAEFRGFDPPLVKLSEGM